MHKDVIAAISTPPGKGGVAIIRMSGEGAVDIAKEVFSPLSGKCITKYPPRTQIYGYVIENGDKIDDGMLTVFPAPFSYTGEETVEISCHGGILVSHTVLKALFSHGATPARAGEFTSRAFINGKLSLTEAEAIGSLLEATSREQIILNGDDSRQRLRDSIDSIRRDITEILSSIYARIDYPDEDLGDFTDNECIEKLRAVKTRIESLKSTYRTGRAINEGIPTVIVGKPNVGKSTLYNLLLGENAAIVTDIAGTTRDLLEKELILGRVKLHITDTAGIREGEGIDTVEKIGIERSKDRLKNAELIFALFDLSRPLDEEDSELCRLVGESMGKCIAVFTKSDLSDGARELPLSEECFAARVTVSKEYPTEAKQRLIDVVEELFFDEKISLRTDAVVANARQAAALDRAAMFIDYAISAFMDGFAQDAASSDIELALGAISELDGRAVAESVTADIFSKFCVGK